MKPDDETPEQPPQGGFFSREEKRLTPVEAVEAWYARHFHRAAIEGRAPLSATDKADLVKAVAEATTKE